MPFKQVPLDSIKPGAVLWADADALEIPADDKRVNDGRAIVRVLAVDIGESVPSKFGVPAFARKPITVTVSRFGDSAFARTPLVTLKAPALYVQTDAPGDPLQPLSVQEHPDKPRTQITYPSGIDMCVVSAPKPSAGFERPAQMEADSKTWQLQCLECPLSIDGPPMVCAWGARIGDGLAKQGSCPHNDGLVKTETGQFKTRCFYSGVGQ